MKRLLCLLALACLLLPATAARAGDQKRPPLKLGEIEVKGEALHRNDIPTTVNVIGAEEFEDRLLLRTEDILLEVPGVELGNYNQGGVANVIKMRGFTSGAHGGDLAIYVDGIPLNEGESHADGYADINVLIPLEIQRLEVYKGPSSALFGNFARGGTLAFYTRKRGRYNKLKLNYGSFHTVDLQGAFGVKLARGLYNHTAFQGARTDGYQEHSRWGRFNGATRFSWQAGDRLELSLALRAHSSDWDAPGYIPKYMFDSGSTNQAPNAENDGGKKTFFTQRLDLGYDLSPSLRLLAWAYSTQQDFTRFAKFGYDPGGQTERYYDRLVWGSGFSLNWNTRLAGRRLCAVAGAEYYHEDTKWKRWNTQDRVRLAQTQDRDFLITTTSLFFQGEYELSPWFRPTLGLRFDRFGGDYRNQDPGGQPYTHDMPHYQHLSPKLGFRSRLLPGLDFRASYCQGFALPKGEAKYQPKLNVDPEVITQYEAGLTYTLGSRLWVDAAWFILDSSDEIQEYPPGSGKYQNLGETRRRGLELAVRAYPAAGLELFGNLALLDSEVRQNADPALEGKEVKGVPDHVFNLGLQYTSSLGLGGRVNWRQVGSYYIDTDNTETYPGYDTVDLTLFYQRPLGQGTNRRLRVSFSVLNLLDEHYAQAVWKGYGTLNYALAWPRTFWLGVSIDW